MKKIYYLAVILCTVGIATNAMAISENANQNQSQNQTQNQETTSTQTQTGYTSSGAQTQEQARMKAQEEFNLYTSNYIPKNQEALNYSDKSQMIIANMLNFSLNLENQGIGEQIRTVAKNQKQEDDDTIAAIDEADKRGPVAKFFIGPNYKELKIAKQEMEQNRLRIQELNQISTQISNQSEQSELQNIIQNLEQQNTELENQLKNMTSGFSIFGWLAKWITGY